MNSELVGGFTVSSVGISSSWKDIISSLTPRVNILIRLINIYQCSRDAVELGGRALKVSGMSKL